MNWIKIMVVFCFLATMVSGEDTYTLKISDFFGECNYTNVEGYSLTDTGVCIGNFISPSINFNLLLQPFTTLYNDVFGFKEETVKKDENLLDTIYNFIVAVLSFPINFLMFFIHFFINFIRFILHFMFKFALVYLLWVSLGFQVMLNYVDRNRTLQHEEKVQLTFALIGVATLYAMVNGLGWIQWS